MSCLVAERAHHLQAAIGSGALCAHVGVALCKVPKLLADLNCSDGATEAAASSACLGRRTAGSRQERKKA